MSPTDVKCLFFFCQALGLSIDAEKLKGFWRLVFTNDAKFVATGGASGFAGIMQLLVMRPYGTSVCGLTVLVYEALSLWPQEVLLASLV